MFDLNGNISGLHDSVGISRGQSDLVRSRGAVFMRCDGIIRSGPVSEVPDIGFDLPDRSYAIEVDVLADVS